MLVYIFFTAWLAYTIILVILGTVVVVMSLNVNPIGFSIYFVTYVKAY